MMLPDTDRIRAVLAAACVGDALGAATEGMSAAEIRSVFGGRVTALTPPPEKAPFARGLTPGRLTDDATQMLAMAEILIETGGAPEPSDAVRGLLAWAGDEETFARFAGPTTRIAVEALKRGAPAASVADPGVYSCVFGTSNGAAMRAPVAGAVRPGDPEGAAEIAALLAAPTHDTQIAFAGAGAIAAAVAHGLGGGAPAGMIGAALEGAAAGERIAALRGRVVGGPSLARRIALAAEIGARFPGDAETAMAELEAVIGNGVAMAEAVPTALGLVVAAGFSPWAALVAAVNGGNDSDTIAMLAGAVAAAYGADDLPEEIVRDIERVNALDLRDTAARLAEAARGRN
ncbi:ADP-ribosylglycohydrolase family protein [Prosthecomicrobium pneumaticum]|uniref:ADP-ribosylglycohydrolase n=1 Tax=Prosthecomicrobium pneumaticum TaxID=81895 RepID=A0A7W9FJM3_9HYPH|nr:ADP-ribosylglycohydrolase family protein [Prosthecomicrobium pneumaticum]MBB5751857.1 ADP-ribosylglycohydrolase [Prosthecomicrobium pneumaticum]